MADLSSKTVFHEIKMHDVNFKENKNEEDAFGRDVSLNDGDQSDAEDDEMDEELRNVDSEEEWDTDLEEERSYTTRRSFIREDHARQVYLAACKQLNIVPANCFIKGIDTQTMNLNFQGLGPLGTRAVATGLVMDRATTHLYLAGNFIGHDGVRHLAEMLRENDFITHLDLSENEIDSYGAKMISEVFKENDTITVLNLSGNRLKSHDAEYIAEILAIPHYIGLRSLDLSHNELGDDGSKIIGHVIGDNETITHLNLSWNQIRRAGIRCLSKGLAENNSLLILDLSSNGVDNEAADLIGKALIPNRKLEELNLNSNRVGFDGIASFFKHLGKNENLKIIKLTNNPITLHGPIAALKLLMKSEISVLNELEIADACVPREFFSVLEEVQTARPQFKVIMGGFMDSKDMCKAEVKTNQHAWKKDPILVFIAFIDERKYKLLDMFKNFDSDKSCSLSRTEFKTGLLAVGCPLNEKQLEQLIDTLDIDKNGEIDIEEFLDGFEKHKRRLRKYDTTGNSRVSSASSKLSPSTQSSRPSSSASSRPQSKTKRMDTQADEKENTSAGMNTNHAQLNLPESAVHQGDKSHLDVPQQPVIMKAAYDTGQDTHDPFVSVPKSASALT